MFSCIDSSARNEVMWWLAVIMCLSTPVWGSRMVRYVAFNPPIIYPQVDHVTVSTRSNYSMTCEGVYPVTWHLPQDGDHSISPYVLNRVTTTYMTNPSSAKMYVSMITVRHMVYTDTGSYICSFNGTDDFTSIDNSTRLHIYVYDESHLLTHPNDDFDFQQFVQYETAVIPCTPTHPNVTVTLLKQGSGQGPVRINVDNQYITYSPKVGFLISPVMPDQHPGVYTCRAEYAGKTNEYYTQMTVLMRTSYVPPPHINRTSGEHVTVSETLALTCTITVDLGVMVRLSWQLPNKNAVAPRCHLPEPVSRNVSLGGSHLKVVEQKILLNNVEKEDQGNYVCIVTDHSGNTKTRREYVRIYDRDQSFLRVWQDGFSTLHKTKGKAASVQWVIQIAAYPKPTVTWYDPDGEVMSEGEDLMRGRTVQSVMGKNPRSMLKLTNLKLEDAGEYVVKVENDFHVKFENFSLVVTEKPKVTARVVQQTAGGLYQHGDQYTLQCTATGYPVPKIQWTFKKCRDYNKCDKRKEIKYRTTEAPYGKFQMDSSLVVVAKDSGKYSCVACGGDNCQMAPIDFFVTDVPDGFAIIGENRVIQGDTVDLKCSASKYNFTEENVLWYKQTVRGLEEVKEKRRGRKRNNENWQIISESTSKFTVSKRLQFASVSPQDSGVYVCRATLPGPKKRHNKELLILERTTELRVQRTEEPKIYKTKNMHGNVTLIMEKGQGIELQCKVRGVPRPVLTWYHDENPVPLHGNPNIQFLDDGMSLRIGVVVEGRDEGKYRCFATSRAGNASLEQTIIKVEAPTIYQTNLLGSRESEKVMDNEARLTLQCQTNGKPQPIIIWTLGGVPINNERANISNRNQTLVVNKFTRDDEGRYECKASNRGGAASAFQWIKLSSSQEAASLYSSSIAVPVFIAVGAALILAIILVAVAKICVSTGRWKAPPTPPTPRLTQFDMPEDEDQEAESCRLTLSRDGSPFIPGVCHGCQGCSGQCHQQQCQGCHYNVNGIYGCAGNMSPINQHFGGNGSLVGVRPGHSPPPGSTCMSDYSHQTLPHNRMYTLRREGTLRKDKVSRSASPRLSAEF